MTVGDVSSTELGSGARYNDNKPDFSMIPLWTLEGEARVWQYGARKYAQWNWAKGMPWSVPFACVMRHLAAFQRGEELDPESGEHHLDHVMCNVRMLRYYLTEYPEGDDRPPRRRAIAAATSKSSAADKKPQEPNEEKSALTSRSKSLSSRRARRP